MGLRPRTRTGQKALNRCERGRPYGHSDPCKHRMSDRYAGTLVWVESHWWPSHPTLMHVISECVRRRLWPSVRVAQVADPPDSVACAS
eukprot:9946709-Alexandrium_andersonii.AAC.1